MQYLGGCVLFKPLSAFRAFLALRDLVRDRCLEEAMSERVHNRATAGLTQTHWIMNLASGKNQLNHGDFAEDDLADACISVCDISARKSDHSDGPPG